MWSSDRAELRGVSAGVSSEALTTIKGRLVSAGGSESTGQTRLQTLLHVFLVAVQQSLERKSVKRRWRPAPSASSEQRLCTVPLPVCFVFPSSSSFSVSGVFNPRLPAFFLLPSLPLLPPVITRHSLQLSSLFPFSFPPLLVRPSVLCRCLSVNNPPGVAL